MFPVFFDKIPYFIDLNDIEIGFNFDIFFKNFSEVSDPILDEASLVSNKQMLNIINIAKTLDIKLILQGDTKQLSSVEAGKPFHQLQQAGMKTVVMCDILRQKNQELKQAVELTINSQIKQAITKITQSLHLKYHHTQTRAHKKNTHIIYKNKPNFKIITPRNE